MSSRHNAVSLNVWFKGSSKPANYTVQIPEGVTEEEFVDGVNQLMELIYQCKIKGNASGGAKLGDVVLDIGEIAGISYNLIWTS